MLIARFRHRRTIAHGVVEGDGLRLITDDFYDELVYTGQEVGQDEVTLLSPVAPGLVIGLGRNYLGHVREVGVEVPETPAIFFKPGRSLIGCGEPIIIPAWATRVDYEGELGLVIGKTMRNVPEDSALEHVFGCTCFNDVTERDVGSVGLINQDISKSCDTFGPCGPFIASGVNPDDAMLRTFLNNALVQQDHTGNTVFSAARVLSYLSRFLTLQPGDLVVTGTPAGIGPLKDGDSVAVEVEGIGRLVNPVVREQKKNISRKDEK